jgi:hypothetical protein
LGSVRTVVLTGAVAGALAFSASTAGAAPAGGSSAPASAPAPAGTGDAAARLASISEFSSETLHAALAEPGVVLVEFYTNKTVPKHRVLEMVAVGTPAEVRVGRVNLSPRAARPLTTRHAIRAVPTFVIFNNGQAVFRTEGAQSAETYIAQINAILEPPPVEEAQPAPVAQPPPVPSPQPAPPPPVYPEAPPPTFQPAPQPAPAPAPAPQPNVSVSVANTNNSYASAGGGAYVPSERRPSRRASRVESAPVRGFVHVAGGVYLAKFKETYFGNDDAYNFGGFSIAAGFTTAHSSVGNLRFQFDVGYYFHGEDRYDYGRRHEYTDVGFICPVTFSPTYEFNLGTPHARLRVGPLIGFTTGAVFYDNGYYRNSRNRNDYDYGTSFTYGGTIGLTVTPGRHFFFDLAYRYEHNSGASMRDDHGDKIGVRAKWHASRIEAALGWRW